jgi:hypothetical protein
MGRSGKISKYAIILTDEHHHMHVLVRRVQVVVVLSIHLLGDITISAILSEEPHEDDQDQLERKDHVEELLGKRAKHE